MSAGQPHLQSLAMIYSRGPLGTFCDGLFLYYLRQEGYVTVGVSLSRIMQNYSTNLHQIRRKGPQTKPLDFGGNHRPRRRRRHHHRRICSAPLNIKT